MNSTATPTHALPDALLAAFIAFPAPLALLDAQGRTTLVNSRFLLRFSAAVPDAATLRALALNPDGIWQSVLLVPRESEDPDATPRKAPAADANPSAVRTRAPLSELVGAATREGMRTLKQDGIEKVLQGHTTMEQVRTACA